MNDKDYEEGLRKRGDALRRELAEMAGDRKPDMLIPVSSPEVEVVLRVGAKTVMRSTASQDVESIKLVDVDFLGTVVKVSFVNSAACDYYPISRLHRYTMVPTDE